MYYDEYDNLLPLPVSTAKVRLSLVMSAHKRRRVSTSNEAEAYKNGHDSSDNEESDDELTSSDEDAPIADGKAFLTVSAGEAYMIGVARKIKTSNLRLSDQVESFTRSTYLAALPPASPVVSDLEKAYDERFDLWRLELEQGFSVILHGLGSKRSLLNRFAQSKLNGEGNVIIINGFAATLSIADVLSSTESVTFDGPPPALKSTDIDKMELRARFLAAHYSQPDVRRLFIVLHNIDGAPFHQPKARSILSLLAAQTRIHLVASIDHVRGPLLFTSMMATRRPCPPRRAPVADDGMEDEGAEDDNSVQPDLLHRGFNFLHHHTPTYLPYTLETLLAGTPSSLFPPSIFPPLATLHSGRSTSSARIHAALSVLASLNDNARSVFKTLANRSPCRFATLFANCRDQFIASSPAHLEALLAEFRDHDIVREGDEPPGDSKGLAEVEEDDEDSTRVVVKPGWIWISLPKLDVDAVLERMDG